MIIDLQIEQRILRSIELDMNNKGGIVYFTQDYLVKANTYKDLRTWIKIRGYHMKRNEENLLICSRFIGRLSENSTTKYKLDNNQIINILWSKRIKAIWVKKFLAGINVGLDWKLQKFKKKLILVPEDNAIYHNSDGLINLRFGNYYYSASTTSNQDATLSFSFSTISTYSLRVACRAWWNQIVVVLISIFHMI